jgi:hypothetical protein
MTVAGAWCALASAAVGCRRTSSRKSKSVSAFFSLLLLRLSSSSYPALSASPTPQDAPAGGAAQPSAADLAAAMATLQAAQAQVAPPQVPSAPASADPAPTPAPAPSNKAVEDAAAALKQLNMAADKKQCAGCKKELGMNQARREGERRLNLMQMCVVRRCNEQPKRL